MGKQIQDDDLQKNPHAVLPLQFIKELGYTTFAAEFAIVDGDLVYHFFVTDEVNELPNPKEYWLGTFPKILDETARTYFKAEYPRLKASYTDELKSWWLRSEGSGLVLDPHKLGYGFLAALDSALEARTTT